MKVVTPPDKDLRVANGVRLFLAGSIEMGKAEDWQSKLITSLSDFPGLIMNPRRADWDSSWEQSSDNPRFREQVDWELSRLDVADVIAFWFCPGTISPITLLELGLHLNNDAPVSIIIGCPKGYSRKGNVDITCERYGREVIEDWDSFVANVRNVVESLGKEKCYRRSRS